MRVVIQRVTEASVEIDGKLHGKIGCGMLILVGVQQDDTVEDVAWTVKKCSAMRIFSDREGVMNLSLGDVGGEVLIVSQFTLMASCKKGNRPSWFRAATHDVAIPLYELFCREMSSTIGHKVATGVFGADMKVTLINDGPVTILLDSKAKSPL